MFMVVCVCRSTYGQVMLDRLAMTEKCGITEEPLNLVSVTHIRHLRVKCVFMTFPKIIDLHRTMFIQCEYQHTMNI